MGSAEHRGDMLLTALHSRAPEPNNRAQGGGLHLSEPGSFLNHRGGWHTRPIWVSSTKNICHHQLCPYFLDSRGTDCKDSRTEHSPGTLPHPGQYQKWPPDQSVPKVTIWGIRRTLLTAFYQIISIVFQSGEEKTLSLSQSEVPYRPVSASYFVPHLASPSLPS